MKKPISITIDPECLLVYVAHLGDSATFDGSLPLHRDRDGVIRDYTFAEKNYVDGGVIIDVTPDDEIIGFEILHVDDTEAVSLARDYAADNGLAFPADLRAAVGDYGR
jgi:hypothetical protein